MPNHGITTKILLRAYAQGYFPMAETADAEELFWVRPHDRGIIPLDTFHIPRRLRRTVAQDVFEVRVDHDFMAVMRSCAAPHTGRDKTWINSIILDLYGQLHQEGHAHSVECWQKGALVGGLYGVALGGAFFGESMFHTVRDASKVALVHLVARLKAGGFVLLDTQFTTPHLQQFGTIEVSRFRYRRLLADALAHEGDIHALPDEIPGSQALALLRDGAPADGD